MNPAYAKKLGLRIWKTDVGTQKIKESSLDTFEMVITSFQVQDKLGKVRFFQESFLITDTKMDIVLGMPFLTLSNVDTWFAEEDLIWKIYMAIDVLLTTKKVQIINRKKFVKVALDPNKEVFVVYVAIITLEMAIHPAHQTQIALLKAEEVLVTIPEEYSEYADIFSEKLAVVLPEYTEINIHVIDLEKGKLPPYGPIYSSRPVELETLKTYIKTNLVNSFICSSKSPAGTSILFDQKLDGSLWLCIDYQGLNNLTIKNWFPFPLTDESLY